MTGKRIHLLSVFGTTGLGLIALTWWLTYNPVKDFSILNPGMDNRPEGLSSLTPAVNIGAFFNQFEGIPSNIQGSWPRFRGETFDNISRESVKLADTWGQDGPPILWSVDLGEGHAGPVVSNGRIYILDYDEQQRRDQLRCFSLDDGQEIWRRAYHVYIKRNHGMSRTIPAVADNYVVTIGPMCHVMCVDAESGDLKWGMDLTREFETEVPLWYTGQCPLIEDSVAVIGVGGTSLLIGVHCETGEVVWKTPNPNKWKMSHSSIIPYVIHGKRMYIYCALGGVVGISAEKETLGDVLFESNLFNRNVIAPSPVYLGDGRLFVTAGYGGGSLMLRIDYDGNTFSVQSLQSLKPNEGLASEQQTPLFHDGHLFAILPKDAGPLRNQFVCYHPDDISKLVWSSGKTERFGLGPYLLADGKFFIVSDDGILTVLEASTREYRQLARAKILDGNDAWGPMALVNGRLLARDSRRLVCLDVSSRN
jgi:outer membrane protein assembly factor BamB